MPMMTYFRTQLLSHGTGSLAPPEMAMPVPKATSLYQTIHTRRRRTCSPAGTWHCSAPDPGVFPGACGSKGVSGLITPDLWVWRERCRDDRGTGRRDKKQVAGTDR